MEATSFSSFDRLVETCRRTRAALAAVVTRSGDEDAVRSILAHDALGHVDAVLEGLTARARAGSFGSTELRALVRRAGILEPPAPGTPDAIAAAIEAGLERHPLRRADGRSILAAEHARVVFSAIPRLPSDGVAWPAGHRSYADIPVPRSESEVLLRAEELARVLWRVAEGDGRRDEPLRRVVAFYDVGARLSVRGFLAA
jgi:hypothetical protein